MARTRAAASGSLSPDGAAANAQPSAHAADGRLSIRSAFAGQTVLLTGGTGYVGSLVAEQLLRTCPGLTAIYVLVRDRGSTPASQRVTKLLRSGLFHSVPEERLSKVKVASGDLEAPELGLSPANWEALRAEVSVVIHCAASINLNPHIQEALQHNYIGTKTMLEAAQSIPRCRLFLHVSSCFANGHRPKGSRVEEEIYPLSAAEPDLPHGEVVAELMALEASAAEKRAAALLAKWGFPGSYCLAKHLAEKLVSASAGRPWPVAIVRPSIVGALAGPPYPGYTGNVAGLTGIALSYAAGFFCPGSIAWRGRSVVDIVPGDQVSSVILATAAAMLQRPGLLNANPSTPAIVHACTSDCPEPLTVGSMLGTGRIFWASVPIKFQLPLTVLPGITPDHEPSWYRVTAARWFTWLRVEAAAALLQLQGHGRLARKLRIGYAAYDTLNSESYDFDLRFSGSNARRLEGMLPEEERSNFPMVGLPPWVRYANTYQAAILRLFMRQSLEEIPAAIEHGFRHIPGRDEAPQPGADPPGGASRL